MGTRMIGKFTFCFQVFLFLQKLVVLALVETKQGTLACLNKSSASMSVAPYPSIPLRVDMLFCCIVCKLEDNSWSRQEHPATQCGLLMAEQRGDGLWWLLILAVGLQHGGSYWSCTPAAVNNSAVPLHHEKPSISWPSGFVNHPPAVMYIGKITVIFLITSLSTFLSAGFYSISYYSFSIKGTLWSFWTLVALWSTSVKGDILYSFSGSSFYFGLLLK